MSSWRISAIVGLLFATSSVQAQGLETLDRNAKTRPSYVLLSGIVGGVGGMARIAAKLRDAGEHVLVIDPYKESIDSLDVSFAALARRVNRLLDSAGITGAHVVGHAHGGGVAMRLAATFPERVAHLYLLDAGAIAASKTKVFSGSIRLIPFLVRIPGGRALVESRFGSGMRENMAQRDWFDKPTRRAYASLILDGPKAIQMASRLAQASEPEDITAVIARINVPVTAVLGGHPHPAAPAPAELQLLRPLGDRFRAITMPNVGHFPHEEAPADLLIIMRSGTGNPLRTL